MKDLIALSAKPIRVVVGLMSGTSVDGIDAAVCRLEGAGPGVGIELLGFRTYAFAPDLRERIFSAFDGSARELCELNFLLGEAFADAVVRVVADLELTLDEIDLIGCSGQTIYHLPRAQDGVTSTLQLGEGSVLAERLGTPVVCDFRTRDVAAGGDGAPLVPLADVLVFQEPGRTRAAQNIGGIANVTVVTEDLDGIVAFDTGPGNMVIDQIARAVSADSLAIDEDGKLSALGRVDEALLAELLAHPYFDLAPPKSTGREQFGKQYAAKLIEGYDPLRLLDLLATAVALTADSIALAYERFVLPFTPIDEVLVSGGGARNLTLMRRLAERLAPIPVRPLEEIGLSSDAKEAVAFALLANETIAGHAGNVPRATGARRPVVLGKIVPA